MSMFTGSLRDNERRRPGITAIYWELRKLHPKMQWLSIMGMAKEEWHKRNAAGVPKL